ncbi:regulatory protein ArsR [Klebsiella aerogenes]|nr:regulatory protein ArsR [Klebsiella aerogenes]
MIANHPEREQIRLENVLSALGNPLRLEIIRTLADGSELSCNALRQEEVAKSTMTHHWRVLRDSGVIWQRPQGRENMISLRREDLDARFSRPAGYAAESYGAGRISSSAGWRFAYPAYITIKFQKVNHHRRPAQAHGLHPKSWTPN